MSRWKLKKILKEKGMSQTDLAREIGVSRSTVCRWLSGQRKIRKFVARVIAEKFGV